MGIDNVFIDGYGRIGRLMDNKLKRDENNPDMLCGQIVPFGEMRKVDVFNIPKDTYVVLTRSELGNLSTFPVYHICPNTVGTQKNLFGDVIMKKLEEILNRATEGMRNMQMERTSKNIDEMISAGDADAYLKKQKKLFDQMQYSKQQRENPRSD